MTWEDGVKPKTSADEKLNTGIYKNTEFENKVAELSLEVSYGLDIAMNRL